MCTIHVLIHCSLSDSHSTSEYNGPSNSNSNIIHVSILGHSVQGLTDLHRPPQSWPEFAESCTELYSTAPFCGLCSSMDFCPALSRLFRWTAGERLHKKEGR